MSCTFTNGDSNTLVVPNPVWPSTSIIDMGWRKVPKSNGFTDFQDNGEIYDRYECDCEWLLNATEMNDFANFLSVDDVNNGRGETLLLDISGGAFHPFTPYRGDVGQFTVKFTRFEQSGSLVRGVYKYYTVKCTMSNAGAFPAYSLPSQVDEGNFGIGTVLNMRFPDGGFGQDISYIDKSIHTAGNTVYSNDRTANADFYRNSFALPMNESKAAALVSYIVSTGRNGDITITNDTDYYAHGRQKGGSTSFTSRLLTPVLQVVNTGYDDFSISLEFEYRS